MLAHWTQVSDRCPLGYLFFLTLLHNGKNRDFLMKMGQKKEKKKKKNTYIIQKCQKKFWVGGLKWVGRATANKQFFILGLKG